MTAERERPADEPRVEPSELAEPAAPAPEAATEEEPPPLHRIATRALAGGLVAAPPAALLLAAAMALDPTGPKGDALRGLPYTTLGLGVFAGVLGLACGLAQRLRRAWRLPVLVLGSATVAAAITGAVVWLLGLVKGGPEAAWEELLKVLAEVRRDPGDAAKLVGFSVVPFLAIGAVRCFPRAGASLPRTVGLGALGGLAGGAALFLLLCAVNGAPGSRTLPFALVGIVGTLGLLGAALPVGDALEARVARAFERGVHGEDA